MISLDMFKCHKISHLICAFNHAHFTCSSSETVLMKKSTKKTNEHQKRLNSLRRKNSLHKSISLNIFLIHMCQNNDRWESKEKMRCNLVISNNLGNYLPSTPSLQITVDSLRMKRSKKKSSVDRTTTIGSNRIHWAHPIVVKLLQCFAMAK